MTHTAVLTITLTPMVIIFSNFFQSTSQYFSDDCGEHIGVNSFAIACTVVEIWSLYLAAHSLGNCMSEFMGLIHGVYDAKKDNLPGGATL